MEAFQRGQDVHATSAMHLLRKKSLEEVKTCCSCFESVTRCAHHEFHARDQEKDSGGSECMLRVP